MLFGTVIGEVVATVRAQSIEHRALRVVAIQDADLRITGKNVVCVDTVQSRVGDLVLICSSSSARATKLTEGTCTDTAIVAIVDAVTPGTDVRSGARE